jgi:DNA-binding beta-propeller fold protein YncE
MSRRASILLLSGCLLAASSPAHARRVPVAESVCDLSDAGALSAAGLAIDGSGNFAVLDDLADTVVFVDRTCAEVQPGFSTVALGIQNGTGIAWNPTAAQFGIIDSIDDQLYFATAAGLSAGSCDLAGIGSTSAKGIAYDTVDGLYAVIDDVADTVFRIDDTVTGGGACALVSQFATGPFGATLAGDITYLASSDQFAVLDSGDDEVYYVSTTGVLADQFDTGGAGAFIPLGGAYDATADRFYVASDGAPPMLYTFDIRGTSSQHCLTSAFGSTTPTGLGVNETTGELLVSDSVTDQIYVLDPVTCAVVHQFGTAGFGSTSPSDVAYLPITDELVVSDSITDQLYFYDEPTGSLTSTCSTSAQGFNSPTGVDYLPDLDLVAVTSDADDTWLLVDTSCNILHARSVGVLDDTGSGNTPKDIAYQPGTGRFLVADSTAEEIFSSSFEGVSGLHFDTAGLGLGVVTGVASDLNDSTAVFLLSDDLDAIYRVTLPVLPLTTSISGRFTSALATVWLWERGEGRVTGTLLKNGNLMPFFGQFLEPQNTLYFGIQNGNKLSTGTMTVSPDRAQMTGPAVFGTLLRDY